MSHLSLLLIGPPLIALGGVLVTTFKTQKVLALLAFLAVEAAHSHRRAQLTGLFWPEHPEAAARANLRVSLHRLREALSQNDTAPFLHITRETIQFNTTSDHWLDVAEFYALIAACQTHPHEKLEACTDCSVRLTQAAALYRGDFLAGLALGDSPAFEEWLLLQREILRRQVLGALSTLAAYHEGRADYAAMCACARRQLELEPWLESAQQQLMRGLALRGERSAALARYEAYCRVLRKELGVEPDAATRALAERIRAGKLAPPSPHSPH